MDFHLGATHVVLHTLGSLKECFLVWNSEAARNPSEQTVLAVLECDRKTDTSLALMSLTKRVNTKLRKLS